MSEPITCTAHRHGDWYAYQRFGCRCPEAKESQRIYRKRLRWQHHNGEPTKIEGWRVRRRIQALQRLGWSRRHIYVELGYRGNGTWLDGSTNFSPDTFARVDALYERLSMTLGPSQWTRTFATKRGWPPPLAWDDIDDPDATPQTGGTEQVYDEVIVDRLLAGEHLKSNRAEKEEAMRRWLAAGRSQRSLCAIHGWQEGRYVEKRAA